MTDSDIFPAQELTGGALWPVPALRALGLGLLAGLVPAGLLRLAGRRRSGA